VSEELKLLASVERALGAAYRQSHTVENIMKDLRPKIETALAAKLAEREAEVVAKRKRKPQDASRWPSGMTQEAIELEIDALCGCAGRHDCDCVSVFHRARSEAWYRHNTATKDNT